MQSAILRHCPLASPPKVLSLRRVKSVLLSALIFSVWALFAFVARCHNVRSVLVDGKIYFADGDCYSRMTRARMVDQHFGTVVRHQEFENYPKGTDTHATAPMDYLIVVTKWVVAGTLRVFDPDHSSILESQTLDVAGALVSPLLGAVVCGFLALAVRGLGVGWGARWTVPLLWAISPIIVWGTILGRPDHQSLQMALLAVALMAECHLARHLTRVWAVVSGVSWALALWVSLYEPAVLFAAVVILWGCMKPRALIAPERRPGWIVFAAILGLALLIEGWPVELPDRAMSVYLANWGGTIGELYHLNLAGPTLYGWIGGACVVSPILLLLACRRDRRAIPALVLFLVTLALTCWQARWGYFMALVFALTLPWQFVALRRWWVTAIVTVVALWPTLRVESLSLEMRVGYLLVVVFLLLLPWNPGGRRRAVIAMLRWAVFAAIAVYSAWYVFRLAPGPLWSLLVALAVAAGVIPWLRRRTWLRMERTAIVGSLLCFSLLPTFGEWRADLTQDPGKVSTANLEKRYLREVAEALRGPGKACFLAPWWTSPALAYWSEQPGVAGSSHEAISGTVDTAKFYLAQEPEEAMAVLKKRDVARVVADDPARLIRTSSAILGVLPSNEASFPAQTLSGPSRSLPPYLIQTFANDYFKVFAVDQAKLHP